MKIENLKLTNRVLSLLTAATITFAPVVNASAAKYKPGTFISETVENGDTIYNQYVVKEGDTLSRISEKICSHFREEISTEFWPALAFLNEYPKVSNPGDLIIYPSTYEKLVELNSKLRELGWTSRYIIKNKIYKKTKKQALPRESIADLLCDIYGDTTCVDEDFIRLYLRAQGLEDKYYLTDNKGLSNETIFELTDWIPTLDELEAVQNNKKSK